MGKHSQSKGNQRVGRTVTSCLYRLANCRQPRGHTAGLANGVEFDVFLEWDRATMRRRDYVEKFRAYGAFFASRQAGQLARCRLLVVTTTPAAERRIAEVIETAAGTAPALMVAYLTTASHLAHAGALSEVWRTADGGGRQTWWR